MGKYTKNMPGYLPREKLHLSNRITNKMDMMQAFFIDAQN